MEQYLALLKDVLLNGEDRMDRTGTGTKSVFGRSLRFDLQEGFPLVTTKRVHYKSVLHELLWMLKGEEHINYLKENGIRIWDPWADENGLVGRMYGVQWRSWYNAEEAHKEFPDFNNVYIDQLYRAIQTIKKNPTDRRIVVTAWNPGELDKMALPPCHMMYQFYVREEGLLDCQVYQRSADCFLGLPFDIASYATLMHMVAMVTGLRPGELIYTLGDTHIYHDHMKQVHLQLTRQPRHLPNLFLTEHDDIDSYEYGDFSLSGYTPHPSIRGDVSV